MEALEPSRLVDHWYVVCRSEDLGRRPLARTLHGRPLVVFRSEEGRPAALLDRCAHRNAPLSLGRTVDGRLECAYHGWQYAGDGACRLVPGLERGEIGKGAAVPSFTAVEQQGFVWVRLGGARAGVEAAPYVFPLLDRPGYVSARAVFDLEAPLLAAIENVLDVPHTAFVHRGLFRGGRRNPVTAIVRPAADRLEVEFVGEPRPSGLAARILAVGDGTVEHYDRFLLPSIAEVEYRLGDRAHLFTSAALTPIDDTHTRMFAVVSLRSPLPGLLARLAVEPIARRIVQQDIRILRAQTETIRRFEGESFYSTELDLVGPRVARMLKQAAAGEPITVGPERRVEIGI
jgi:phenylpropionate dioxygenase-like ring-hydroxylating dioxygenase large terminal subunit